MLSRLERRSIMEYAMRRERRPVRALDRGGGADNFRISPIARWARPPGDAIDFGATVTGSLLVTPPGARDPGDGASLAAPITNANESARGVAAVALASAARPVQVAIAACDAQPAIVPLPVQLEKSTPPLVPADRAEAEYRRGIELHERARASDAEAAFAAALLHDGRHAAARRAIAVGWIGTAEAPMPSESWAKAWHSRRSRRSWA